MKVTGSLQVKRGIYQMMFRVEEHPGRMKQHMKSTGLRAIGRNQRETRANKLAADRMLAAYMVDMQNGASSAEITFLESVHISVLASAYTPETAKKLIRAVSGDS